MNVMEFTKRFFVFVAAIGALASACSTSREPVDQGGNSTANKGIIRADRPRSTIEHTTENQPPAADINNANNGGSRWTQSGDPIDTSAFDRAIAAAERSLKAKPNDAAAKSAAADAYFKRGFALTEARQYAAALGDYRQALKIEPGHEEAKTWENRIIGIYEMMKKEFPKPGEEPPPLPFKK